MPTQLTLAFDVVPITREAQQRYHSIAPCLAGVSAPAEQAQALNLGYSTITRWLLTGEPARPFCFRLTVMAPLARLRRVRL
jgi:hypothetical protein